MKFCHFPPSHGEEEKEEPEKEEVLMTLDEWKKIQEESRAKVEYQSGVRKAGEGEKKGQWKNTSVLKKEESEDLMPSRRVRTVGLSCVVKASCGDMLK